MYVTALLSTLDWITPETLAQIHQEHEIRRQFGSKQ